MRVTLPHGESRESHLARVVVVHATMCVDMPDANRLSVLSSDACHMCVDLPIAVSQRDLPLLQSAHIAGLRDVSGVDHVRVTLPHRESRDSYLAPVVVVHATMCIDMSDVALQRALPRLQSAHISVLRDVSGVDLVRVTIPHGES